MPRTQSIITLVILVIIILSLAVITFVVLKNNQPPSDLNATLSVDNTSTLTDLEGRQVALYNQPNQIRIINFWASWSPYSLNELRILNDTIERLGKDDIQVIAINRAEPKVRAKSYIEQIGELPNITFVIDQEDELFDNIEGYTMPETRFFNAEGQMIHHHRGVLSEDLIERYIQQARE